MAFKTEIFKAFGRQAGEYEKAAVIQREIANRLFERLIYLKMQPRVVLDLGCGTGYLTEQLKTFYPDALVIGLDHVALMLNQACLKPVPAVWLQADMTALPFQDASIDLVLANQVIHWAPDLNALFHEIQRVLCANGCFMFSTLGPDTFAELEYAFSKADDYAHVHPFMDMHDIGDALLAQYFLDPVVDREDVVVHYPDLKTLLYSLKSQGIRNIHPRRSTGLMGKQAWQRFKAAYEERCMTQAGKAKLTYEVLYGQAWKGSRHAGREGVEAWVSLEGLRRS